MTNIEISWQSAPWWFGIKWRSLCVERMPRRPELFAKEVQSLWLKLERSLCCLFAQNFVTAAFPPPVQEAKIWKSASYFAMVVTIIIAIMVTISFCYTAGWSMNIWNVQVLLWEELFTTLSLHEGKRWHCGIGLQWEKHYWEFYGISLLTSYILTFDKEIHFDKCLTKCIHLKRF